MLVCILRTLRTHSIYLVPHDDGAGFGVIHVAEIHCPLRKLGGIETEILIPEAAERLTQIRMSMHRHPGIASPRGLAERTKSVPGPYRMHVTDAEGVAGAQNGRKIAGFVDLIGHHGKIGLAAIEGLFDTGKTSGSHWRTSFTSKSAAV